MSNRLITIEVGDDTSQIVADNKATTEAEITIYVQFVEAGSAQRLPLDLDRVDGDGESVYFPVKVPIEGELKTLPALMAWMDATFSDPEVAPDDFQWDRTGNSAFRSQLQRMQFTEQIESIPIITRKSLSTPVIDVIDVIDQTGKQVEFSAGNNTSPVITIDGVSVTGMAGMSTYLNETYPAKPVELPDGGSQSAGSYAYGPRVDAVGKVWFQIRMPFDSERSPDTINAILITPLEPRKPKPGHWGWASADPHVMQRTLANGTLQYAAALVNGVPVKWESGPLGGGDGPANTPIVLFDRDDFPNVIRGIHGLDGDPGFIDALQAANLPAESFQMIQATASFATPEAYEDWKRGR